jgi:hypothetical protein
LWTIFKGWKSWTDLFQVGLVSIPLFFALWGLTFFVSLMHAPRFLDEERQNEANRLNTQLKQLENRLAVDPLELDRRKLLAEQLRDFATEEKETLRLILTYGKVYRAELRDQVSENALAKAKNARLVNEGYCVTGLEWVEIKPEFRSALDFVLRNEQ